MATLDTFGWKIAIVLLSLGSARGSSPPSPPKLPTQFTAKVNITAHHVDRTRDYPPWLKQLEVFYDYENKRFRSEFLHTRRTAVRRYDQGEEFLVTRVDGFTECKISKLRDEMPAPTWPAKAVYQGTELVLGGMCHHWREDHGASEVNVFLDARTGAPVRVQVESVEQTEPVRLTTPDVTYDVYAFKPGAISANKFGLPKDVKGGRDRCERQPNDVGFPYVHFFHHYYHA
mmetsp:Transcript_518/g.1115  ORF Transcript_518/g.1115 Transcript_518/m.1115 type:complete len:230 (-) Transcript_518:163-852(-)